MNVKLSHITSIAKNHLKYMACCELVTCGMVTLEKQVMLLSTGRLHQIPAVDEQTRVSRGCKVSQRNRNTYIHSSAVVRKVQFIRLRYIAILPHHAFTHMMATASGK